MGFQKNVAGQKWRVFAFDRTDNMPATGDRLQITSKIAVDYGTRTASDATNPDELENGYYEFEMTQGESNGDVLDIYPESSTDDIQVIGVPGRSFTVPSAFAATTMRGTDSAATATNLATTATNLATVATNLATVDGIVDDILVDTGTTLPGTITTIDGIVDNILVDTGTTIPGTITALQADATAIVADTNELQTDDVPGLIAALNDPSAATITDAVWDETQSGHVSVGSFGVMASEIASILVDTGTTLPGTITTIDGIVDSILVDTETTIPATITALRADLPAKITKNVALAKFPFLMVDATDFATPKTGLTITATRSIDGEAFASCANSATELSVGVYVLDLAASDLNGDTIIFRFTATGAADRFISIVTQPT